MKLISAISSAIILAISPIYGKTHYKTDRYYNDYWKYLPYREGWIDGYNGYNYRNIYIIREDSLLYELGYLEGEDAYYLERRKCR